jgi:nanoRNase/pAp phosphatase (c-di-AMP/oligoRNAs hydrolase)
MSPCRASLDEVHCRVPGKGISPMSEELLPQTPTSSMQRSLHGMLAALAGAEEVLILPHTDPDPDGIASALALRHLLTEKLRIHAKIVYKGIIGRAENKALVRYLGCPLRRLVRADLEKPATFALVDTQPGAGNNVLPPKHPVSVVLDHHPWRDPTAAATFHDIRAGIGATSTILTQYLRAADLEPPSALATALFYGVKTDTMGLSRDASQEDVAAYFYLQPRIDIEALVKIERAQVPAAYFASFAATLRAARIYDDVLVSYVGQMGYPDLAAEMADLLLRLEGVQWVICIGVYEDEMALSVRTLKKSGGADRLVQEVVGDQGTAGGHGAMAAGHLLLGSCDPELLAHELGRRVLGALGVAPDLLARPLV